MISMSTFSAVKALLEIQTPKRAIARQLGLNVRTVRKYAKRIDKGETQPIRQKPKTKLQNHADSIKTKVEQGLSAVQIFQDLQNSDPSLEVSYETVKRMVRGFRATQPKVYQRLSFKPGEEAQIDFGDIGRIEVEGKKRRVFLFAMTLCYSRYSYYELVLDQKVPTFLGLIKRAFEDFGGAPERIKPDNLKSAVLLTKLKERYYQKDFYKLCKHYGTLPDAARPRTPTDKGRCERDIGYVKGSCFRGRQFGSFEEAQNFLAQWRKEIAVERLHGTTRKKPREVFETEEREALKALPEDDFVLAQWGQYKVRKDCHIKLQGSFYSVPYQYVGKTVLARLTEDLVTIFAEQEQVAKHARAKEPGQDVTDKSHYPVEKRLSTQQIHRERVAKIRDAGCYARDYLEALRQSRLIFGDQIKKLARLCDQYGSENVDRACQRALYFKAFDGAYVIKRILERGLQRSHLPEEERVCLSVDYLYGRSLEDYQALLEQRRAS